MPNYTIRRRPRECKTCLPCRASKVRCDRKVPCGNCVKRNFNCAYGRPPPTRLQLTPGLTASPTPLHYSSYISPGVQPEYAARPRDGSYVPDNPPGSSDGPEPSEMIDISQAEWDEINTKMVAMEQILGSLHSLFQAGSSRRRSDGLPAERRHPFRSEGVYGSNVLKTGRVHLGSRAALVDILNQSKGSEDAAQALPQEDLLAELALGNESAAYPFVDLWSSDPYTFNIAGVCGVLPNDDQCRRLVGMDERGRELCALTSAGSWSSIRTSARSCTQSYRISRHSSEGRTGCSRGGVELAVPISQMLMGY